MRRQIAFECPGIERPRQSRCVSIEYLPLDPVRNAPFGVREYRACGGWSSSTIEAPASPGAVGVLTVFSLVKYAGPMNSKPRLGLKRCADVHRVAGAVRSKWAERHSSSLVVVAKLEGHFIDHMRYDGSGGFLRSCSIAGANCIRSLAFKLALR